MPTRPNQKFKFFCPTYPLFMINIHLNSFPCLHRLINYLCCHTYPYSYIIHTDSGPCHNSDSFASFSHTFSKIQILCCTHMFHPANLFLVSIIPPSFENSKPYDGRLLGEENGMAIFAGWRDLTRWGPCQDWWHQRWTRTHNSNRLYISGMLRQRDEREKAWVKERGWLNSLQEFKADFIFLGQLNLNHKKRA